MNDETIAHPDEGDLELREWTMVSQFLQRRDTYSDLMSAPHIIETHASLVVMTNTHVYKLKKPVHFDFLDFSSRGKRKKACEQELTLNARLAPGIYLGLATVTIDSKARLGLNGRGRILEWLVLMRRLPAERMLDQLFVTNTYSRVDIERLATYLAAFYNAAPKVPLSLHQYTDRLRRRILANRHDLLSTIKSHATVIKRIHGRLLQFVAFEAALLDSRLQAKRMVDGHGDLRPEHVCLLERPVVFDCIEFSDELRQIDIIDDLAFFDMECERLKKEEVGRWLLSACTSMLHDNPPRRLIDFYKAYRADVRAKIAALRFAQVKGDAGVQAALIQAYLGVADRPLGKASRTLCLIMRGRSGTGKSTLARPLADMLGMELLQTDRLRRDLFGPKPTTAHYGEGRYTPEQRLTVYQSLFRWAESLLVSGVSVVLDGCFLTRDLAQQAAALATRIGALPVSVQVSCEEALVRQRLGQRDQQSLSDARFAHYREQEFQEYDDPSKVNLISVDSSKVSVDTLSAKVMEDLSKIVMEQPHSDETYKTTA